jgi:N-acyl-D-amino-acid deacylase
LEQVRPAVNVALLIGHNTLRRQVVGYENRPARPDELREMVQILEQALDEGGRGFSTGLVYPPGMHAAREELVALARVASRHSGMYTSHMRSEGNRLIEAIQETLAIGQAAGVSVEVSHLKVTGRDNWGKIDDALAELRAARAAGQAVAADRYPYTSGATDLDVVLPDWAAEGGREATLKRLRDPGSCARLLDDLAGSRPASDWDGVTIGSTVHPENHRFRGMLLPEAARVLGVSIPEAILHFGRTDNLCTGAFFAGMSGANMRRILVEPYVMIGSDASLRATEGPLSTDYPHPRAYGAFPRFLRMCLDEHFMPLAEAIRKMTALPASHFNLSGRGILAKGNRADIIVFNPSRFTDRATYGAPHQYAEGIEHVLVNGVLTLSEGHLTGLRAGVFID